MKNSRKGEELSPTHPNVNLEVSQVPLALQAWHQGTWLPPTAGPDDPQGKKRLVPRGLSKYNSSE